VKKVKLFLKNLHSLVVKHEDVLVDRSTDSQRLVWMRIPAFPGVIRGKSLSMGSTMGFMSQGSMDFMCKYYLSGLTEIPNITWSIMLKTRFLG